MIVTEYIFLLLIYRVSENNTVQSMNSFHQFSILKILFLMMGGLSAIQHMLIFITGLNWRLIWSWLDIFLHLSCLFTYENRINSRKALSLGFEFNFDSWLESNGLKRINTMADLSNSLDLNEETKSSRKASVDTALFTIKMR